MVACRKTHFKCHRPLRYILGCWSGFVIQTEVLWIFNPLVKNSKSNEDGITNPD